MKIFSAVRGLEVLSKPIFFEATSAHPKFYVEKHGLPICNTPASVLIYANLCLRKQQRKPLQLSIEITTALTIPPSQALEFGEFGNVTIGNVNHTREILTLFVCCSNRKNKIFSKIQNSAMNTIKEKQCVDRKLFSELIESTFSPTFLNMTQPLTGSLNTLQYLRINGESPHVR